MLRSLFCLSMGESTSNSLTQGVYLSSFPPMINYIQTYIHTYEIGSFPLFWSRAPSSRMMKSANSVSKQSAVHNEPNRADGQHRCESVSSRRSQQQQTSAKGLNIPIRLECFEQMCAAGKVELLQCLFHNDKPQMSVFYLSCAQVKFPRRNIDKCIRRRYSVY